MPGVGGVHVIPLWDGPGSVKVVLIGTDKYPANENLVNDVQNYIAPTLGTGEGKAPIGANVTVAAAEAIDIEISATVELTGTRTLMEVKTAFETALTEYLGSIAFTANPNVKYTKIGSMLLVTDGVEDFTDLKVNNSTERVLIDASKGEVAVKGTVTLNEQLSND
ncbi:hypothetical protein N752_29235 [Desulforamulus aquiferis]|nr:hypothetical protein N752_29235 [Desulforamulus aquiferis]